MNFRQFSGFTAAMLCSLMVWAAEGAGVIPVVVAESEQFEAVGRLEAEGLVWFIDRAESNAPVLNATLTVEAAGKSVAAVFRPERGDYLIADTGWLQPLRQEGEHPLALTLVAGDDSDLLAGELTVHFQENSGFTAARGWKAWLAGGGLLALLAVIGLRRRQGGKA